MKTLRFLLSASLLACAFVLTGCATATRVRISSPQRSVEVVFPKNLAAERLDFDVDPQTGEIRFRSTKLRTDASSVIDSTGSAIGDAAKSLAPLVQ